MNVSVLCGHLCRGQRDVGICACVGERERCGHLCVGERGREHTIFNMVLKTIFLSVFVATIHFAFH